MARHVEFWLGAVRCGKAGVFCYGPVRQGEVWHGLAWQARLVTLRLVKARLGGVRHGEARLGRLYAKNLKRKEQNYGLQMETDSEDFKNRSSKSRRVNEKSR